jgi:hypothetical protein
LKINGAPKLLDGKIPQDSDLLQLLDSYRPQLEKSKSIIVGSTKVFLNGSCRLQECNLGNFMAICKMGSKFVSLGSKVIFLSSRNYFFGQQELFF